MNIAAAQITIEPPGKYGTEGMAGRLLFWMGKGQT
jgi:hypothetical protein